MFHTFRHYAQAVAAWARQGFINYFGLQRFGSYSVGTHDVGRKLLQGDFKAAVDLVLQPRDGEQDRVAHARKVWVETRDAHKVSV